MSVYGSRRNDANALMKNPPNPGHHVPLTYLEPLPLSVTEAARRLGITRQTLNNVFNKKSAISPEIALRFEKIEMGYGGRLNDPANEL